MTKKFSIVSVIICTYNRAPLLNNCLKSLKNQTADKNKYEIIVIDNNSTDNTQDIINDYKKGKLEISSVIEKQQGLGPARNRGWQEAKGKYVAYIDDDALAEPDWIEQIILFNKRYPAISAFGGPYKRYSLKSIPNWIPIKYFSLYIGNHIKQLNLTYEWISGSNMIYKKSLFKRVGNFSDDICMKGNKIVYGDETEFLLRLQKMNEPVYYVPDIRIKHLVADYKLHFWWLLKNDYIHGFSNSLMNKNSKNFGIGLLYFIISLCTFPLYLLNNNHNPFKRKIYFGLSKIFYATGRIIGSINVFLSS